MKKIILVLVVALLVIAAGAYKNSRFGVTSPAYEVLEKDGPFEVRRYASLMLVGTALDSDDPTEGSSFMRLFQYISGSNGAEQKISMTTPVVMSDEHGRRRMSFIVPQDVVSEGAPVPESQAVDLERFEGGRFAVYRYSGGWGRADYEESVDKLRQWVRARDLQPRGNPIAANYDPPFMPSFLRRNEVWIRLAT